MIGISLLSSLLFGCEGIPDQYIYRRTGLPGVLDIGEMRPVEIEEYWQTSYVAGEVVGGYGPEGGDAIDDKFDTWYDLVPSLGAPDSQGRPGIYYGEIGAAEKGVYGGVTLSFRGTGGNVCVVVDPEAVFWNQQRSSDVSSEYIYQDRLDDDGDLDMGAGLSAYYTGNPGVSMGDFRVPFTDAAGEDQYVEFDECAVIANGQESYWGRATAESCTIDTSLNEGVYYTVAIGTFSLPINDTALAFGVGVFEVGEGGCSGSASSGSSTVTAHPPAAGVEAECVLPAEWSGGVPDGDGTPAGDCGDKEGEWDWECLERVFCQGKPNKLNTYCAAHITEEDPPCIDNGHVVLSADEGEE